MSAQRMTHQRRVILEELGKVKTHPTADELYEKVRQRLPRISLGTVYRNLDVLSRTGAILKLTHCGSQARFDACTKVHYHVQCVRCGRVDDLGELPAGFAVENAANFSCPIGEYEIVGYRIEFVGVCPSCRSGS